MAAPDDEDSRYHSVLDTLSEMAQSWHNHRATINAAVGLLSSELIRLQHIFDQFVKERAEERKADEVGRTAARREARRYRWGIIVALVLLIVVNLLVLVYLLGRDVR